MTSRNRLAALFRRILPLATLAALALLLTIPLQAAEGGRKLLKLDISKDRRSAEVVVPEGYGRVTLMRFDRNLGWRRVASRAVSAGVESFKLPASSKDTRWRAVGVFSREKVARKFPAKFYQGKKSFKTSSSRPRGFKEFMAARIAGEAPPAEDSGDEPVEADIWKIDGSTVYFFNQLRGLQVLDIARPADPRLIASMRLPAVGEDLYLLPGTGTARDLVLITRHESTEGETSTRIRIVRHEGGKLSVRFRADAPGYLTDSRMSGERLILATTEWGYSKSDGGYSLSKSRITEWFIRPGTAPKAGQTHVLQGSDPVISAGSDWLAAAVTPNDAWNRSDITVFSLGKSGFLRMNGLPIRAAGAVRDKFKMQWRDHVLTTISERVGPAVDWVPVTVLQTFRVWGPGVMVPAVITDPRLGSLELAKGESLYATRFSGNKAYIVTFLQTDPLWIVDLTDPARPVVAGHIEVPGWSTYLQPVGDMLFSVGWESNTVAASLFDVADPSSPKLLRRVNLGPPGSFSEAAWDEQALRLLPDDGLALIPVSHYDATSGGLVSMVQLLDVDLKAGDLRPRGAIAHAFDARRSDLVGGTVLSISQRELIAADVTDRDKPALLSQVALAWPVDHVLDGGNHLVQIEAGNSWSLGRATARISPADDPEAVLTEIDLGSGVVRDVSMRGGKLYVLRDSGSYGWFARSGSLTGETGTNKAHLDIYDAAALPALPRLGGVSLFLRSGQQVSSAGLLWPQPQRPSILIQPLSSFWYGWDYPLFGLPSGVADFSVLKSLTPSAARATKIAIDPIGGKPSRLAPQVVAFDVADPTSPAASARLSVGSPGTLLNEYAMAGGGLIVAGSSDGGGTMVRKLSPVSGYVESMHVIAVGETGDPVVRPGIDLPGNLFAVTQIDANGFLAWTREWDTGSRLRVLASDGYDAYEVASLDGTAVTAATASGRSLFTAGDKSVRRRDLGDDGSFTDVSSLKVPEGIYSLRVSRGVLIAASWNSVSAAGLTETTAKTWRFPTWSMNADGIRVARDGDLLVPFGEYGAERIDR